MKFGELLFPRRCVLCDTLLTQYFFEKNRTYLCAACEKKIPRITEPRCMRCGRTMRDGTREYCTNCRDKHYAFSEGRALFTYEGAVKKMMYRYKYGGARWYTDFFLEETKDRLSDWIVRRHFDLVLSVPIHKKRFRQRGYNQAALLSDAISRTFHIETDKKILTRCTATLPQKTLGYEDRKNNLKNAFILEKNGVLYSGEKILIVDDIFTTGATVDAIARLIKSAHDCEVSFLSVCVGRDD